MLDCTDSIFVLKSGITAILKEIRASSDGITIDNDKMTVLVIVMTTL